MDIFIYLKFTFKQSEMEKKHLTGMNFCHTELKQRIDLIKSIEKRKISQLMLPRWIIPETVFRGFPTETLRKIAVSDRNMLGIRRRNRVTVSDCQF